MNNNLSSFSAETQIFISTQIEDYFPIKYWNGKLLPNNMTLTYDQSINSNDLKCVI